MMITIMRKIKMNLGLLFLWGSLMLQAQQKPNILIIMVDDMGYSDIGCYGGEIQTPNLDKLASNGIRFSQSYNTSKCNTSRESLLCGRYVNMKNQGSNFNVGPTIGEVAQKAGYRTLMVGKNHNAIRPPKRGFDRFMGIQGGGSNYYAPSGKLINGDPVPQKDIREWMVDDKWVKPYQPIDPNFYVTDVFTDYAINWLNEYEKEENPFLLYVAYNAPHSPVQAPADVVKKYIGKYDDGFESVRNARYKRMVEKGMIDPKKSPLYPQEIDDWKEMSPEERAFEAKCMEVYAAAIDKVDQNIGRMISLLEKQGKLDNTLIWFMSDNGAERVRGQIEETHYVPTGNERIGGPKSYPYIGKQWSYVSNTPLAYYKKTSHEGGIRTPTIAHWPKFIKEKNSWYHEPIHLVDIMSTVLELTNQKYPKKYNNSNAKPIEGVSLLPALKNKSLAYRKHKIGNDYKFGKMIRIEDWKLVKFKDEPWELYDLSKDLTETNDLAKKHPEKLAQMIEEYKIWVANCGSNF